jgi:hypothetical protein
MTLELVFEHYLTGRGLASGVDKKSLVQQGILGRRRLFAQAHGFDEFCRHLPFSDRTRER